MLIINDIMIPWLISFQTGGYEKPLTHIAAQLVVFS
jgi:hypothetical protein